MKLKSLSIVVPIFNEAESIIPLCDQLTENLKVSRTKYEMILVNDGSNDGSQEKIDACKKTWQNVVGLRLKRNLGKAAALQLGFAKAKNEVIVTMDGDLQDDPKELKKLLVKLDLGYDLVIGWKKNRQDSFTKRLSSRLFNLITNLIFRLNLHDYNSGYKAFRAESIKRIRFYGELHRFIPILVADKGYLVTEVPVHHRKRKFGKSKYGSGRFFHGLFDLTTVLFLTKFRFRPLHLFGYVGLVFFLLGTIGGGYLTWLKFVYGQAIGQRPLLLLSSLLIIVGIQIGITGLLGELIVATFLKDEHQELSETHQ